MYCVWILLWISNDYSCIILRYLRTMYGNFEKTPGCFFAVASGGFTAEKATKLTQTTFHWVHGVPQEGGRMQGWESKRWGGFPYLKIKKVYWFSVLVSWFQTCFMFSKYIRYILPNSHSCFFDRYQIHIQAFWDFISTTLHHFPILIFVTYNKEWGNRSFKKIHMTFISKKSIFRILRYENYIFSKTSPYFSCMFGGILVIVKRSIVPDFVKSFEFPVII